jgi:hypothetical protein
MRLFIIRPSGQPISWVSNAGNVLPRKWKIFPPIGCRLLECGSVDPFEQGYRVSPQAGKFCWTGVNCATLDSGPRGAEPTLAIRFD